MRTNDHRAGKTIRDYSDIRAFSGRWERIVHLVRENGRVSIEELTATLQVSASTIRRDLAQMQRQGLLARSRGGAVALPRVAFDRSLVQARKLYTEEKEQIGRLAATLVENGETIMMDAGSTVYATARFLAASEIVIVTNNLDIVSLLASRPNVDTIVIGGTFRPHGGHTFGSLAVNFLAGLRADKAILGIDAVSAIHGLSTPHPEVAELKRTMIAHSQELIVVADHSKLRGPALCHVAPISAVAMLVTDSRIDQEEKQAFTDVGVEVLAAGPQLAPPADDDQTENRLQSGE